MDEDIEPALSQDALSPSQNSRLFCGIRVLDWFGEENGQGLVET